MGVFGRLFGGGDGGAAGSGGGHDAGDGGRAGPAEHGVTIAIPYEPDAGGEPVSSAFREAAESLVADLDLALRGAHVGTVDGDAYGDGVWTVFLCGADADAIWEAVVPLLEPRPMPKGSVAIKRYGPLGADRVHEEQVDLHWDG